MTRSGSKTQNYSNHSKTGLNLKGCMSMLKTELKLYKSKIAFLSQIVSMVYQKDDNNIPKLIAV